jgi:SAM-dependent methyltransferase
MTPAAAEPSADLEYAGYEVWKGWHHPFTYGAEDAQAFAGEMRGLKVADADVLEIGFGEGRFLAWARDQGARVCGIEIIPALIEAARGAGFTLLDPDIRTHAERHARAFDTIVAFDVFEHFTIDVVAERLAACAAMLRPGGHLVLRFPNAQSPFGLTSQNGDPTHRCALSRSGIEQLTQGGDLVVVSYRPSFRITGGGFPKSLVRRLRYIARDVISLTLNAIYATDIPWDPNVVIVLRKQA